MAFRMKYKRQIGELYIHYNDNKLHLETLLTNYSDGMHPIALRMETERLEIANKVFLTIKLLFDLTRSQAFREAFRHESQYEEMTAEQHIEAINVMIADRTKVLEDVKQCYKGTKRNTERYIKKQIEGLKWCKDSIANHILPL